MKKIISTFIFIISTNVIAAPQMIDPAIYCNGGQYSVGYAGGIYCWDEIPSPGTTNCPTCGGWNYNSYRPYNPYTYFPSYPFYPHQMNPQYNPWYAQQAQLYYPNYNYPGVWQPGGQGIQHHHYPGGGGGMAAKPNVYVQNPKVGESVTVSFAGEQLNEMLVTTPALDNEGKWSATVTEDNKFVVNNTKYDYLFYDLRFDHKKLQYKHGFCSDRKTVINYMLKDIKELDFPEVSQKDFDEHWNQKIPQIEYYCLYPQYNEQLDQAYPVKITPQVAFVRTLYLVIPHYKKPKVANGIFPPLPVGHPAKLRKRAPSSKDMVLKEWGVAFLMDNEIKN